MGNAAPLLGPDRSMLCCGLPVVALIVAGGPPHCNPLLLLGMLYFTKFCILINAACNMSHIALSAALRVDNGVST